MNSRIVAALRDIITELYGIDIEPILNRPEQQFGDFSTNIALQLAGQVGQKPRDIADAISDKLRETDEVVEVSVAGPGFINISLSDAALLESWSLNGSHRYRHQTVVVEYSDPNPFKTLHAGHLYTSVMGNAIANLVETAGATVHRVNFGGDVGLHVGKTMWAIITNLGGETPEKLDQVPESERADWLRDRYVEGNNAYEEQIELRPEIVNYNKRVYALHNDNDHESDFAKIYWTTRTWSYDAFDAFYERIGTHFEKYYPESQVSERGLKEVRSQVGEVFSESNGAVVFAGEAFGLHTRVFINSEGLPTYEAKDVGLLFTKYDDYAFDRSIVITGNDQQQYMQVVLRAVEEFAPELAHSSLHLTHGLVKLAGGFKMSSRKGTILRATDVLDVAKQANVEMNQSDDERVSLGAVKYAFLKQRMGGDIIYDPEESVSLQGNSGPYLQYAHARAVSILSKATQPVSDIDGVSFDAAERTLLLKLSEYPETVDHAVEELLPHVICTYLYELAQVFNRFYEKSRVIDDPRQSLRLLLVERYAQTLNHGLKLIGISAPDKL